MNHETKRNIPLDQLQGLITKQRNYLYFLQQIPPTINILFKNHFKGTSDPIVKTTKSPRVYFDLTQPNPDERHHICISFRPSKKLFIGYQIEYFYLKVPFDYTNRWTTLYDSKPAQGFAELTTVHIPKIYELMESHVRGIL